MKLYHVDAFSDRPFGGNPAAVCLLERAAPERWMQALAAEMNLSETAFCYPIEGGYDLRWFTPKVEVDLCGHATLATAHVLREQSLAATGDLVKFHTRSGWLSAELGEAEISLNFPAIPVTQTDSPSDLIKALGLVGTPLYSGLAGPDRLLQVSDAAQIPLLAPDFPALIAHAARGVMVTAAVAADSTAWPGVDFISRFFGPAAGINEDPVTGSAHCALGPFWQARLHKNPLRAYQCSARGGGMRVEVLGQRVRLSGRALTVLRAELSDACRHKMTIRHAD